MHAWGAGLPCRPGLMGGFEMGPRIVRARITSIRGRALRQLNSTFASVVNHMVLVDGPARQASLERMYVLYVLRRPASS